MVLRPNLGKKPYTVYRDVGGGSYVHGVWTSTTKTTVTIKANIQPANATQTKVLPEGEREKEIIWISSNDYVYSSRKGTSPLEADQIMYNGVLWEVRYAIAYQNLGFHVEALAIKMDNQTKERTSGDVTGLV